MAKVTSRLGDWTYVLMRVVIGLAFAEHGAQKLLGVLGGSRVPFMSQMGVAGVIELAGGLMVAFGLFPRWAALVAAGEMAYAYFTVHAPHGLFPIQNRGELALLYGFVFLYIAARGGGRFALTRD